LCNSYSHRVPRALQHADTVHMNNEPTYTITVSRLSCEGAQADLAGRYVGSWAQVMGKVAHAFPELDLTVEDMLREVDDYPNRCIKTDQVDVLNPDGTTSPALVEVTA